MEQFKTYLQYSFNNCWANTIDSSIFIIRSVLKCLTAVLAFFFRLKVKCLRTTELSKIGSLFMYYLLFFGQNHLHESIPEVSQ